MRFWISLGDRNMTHFQMFEKFTKKVGTKLHSYRFFELQIYCPAPPPPHTLLSRVSTFFLDSKLFWGWGNRTARHFYNESTSSHPNEHAWVMTMVGSDTLCSKIWALCFWASPSKQQHYAENYARKVALCSGDLGLIWCPFPFLQSKKYLYTNSETQHLSASFAGSHDG